MSDGAGAPGGDADLVALLRRRELAPRVRERLEMVKAAALGQDRATISRWSGWTEATVQRWLDRFAVGGMAALADADRSGRPALATTTYLEALDTAVATAPRTLALPFDIWTSPRLSAYLAEQTGVRIAPSWLRTLLKQRQWRCGRPKHTLTHLQDAEEVTACIQELAEVGEKGGGDG